MNKQSKDYKARKKIGQFFTESKLAEKLIEMFELDFNNKVIVEPSCGDGVFIKQIIKKSPLFKNIIELVDYGISCSNYNYSIPNLKGRISCRENRFCAMCNASD